MKGAVEVFISGSPKLKVSHTFRKIHWMDNKSQQKDSMQEEKLSCYQLWRNTDG